jgi:hypothetical protein
MSLSPPQIEELLDTLTGPVTNFDCGTLCAPSNGGVPVCCHAPTIVPVLYTAEMAVMKRRTELWRKLRRSDNPTDYGDLTSDLRKCDLLAICKGVEHCERENRSLACRTFPFEPYLDHDRQLAGLVFNFDFEDLCPLVNSRHPIRKGFVVEALDMWTKMFAMSPVEEEFYFKISQSIRRRFGQWRSKIPVFTPQGVRRYPTAR